MKDWYGRTLRLGDYVRYGHPNSHYGPRDVCKIIDICSKRGVNIWELEFGDIGFTFPHNVIKVKEDELVILRLQGKI